MFLDVKGIFTTEKIDTDIENTKKRIIEGFNAVHAKTNVNQSGEISWRGSYFPYEFMKLVPWGLIQRMFWLMKGRIAIQKNPKGGLDLQYQVSLLLYRILLVIVNTVTLYYYLSTNVMLSKIVLFVALEWLFLYGAAYLSAKFGMNSFLSEQILNLKRQRSPD